MSSTGISAGDVRLVSIIDKHSKQVMTKVAEGSSKAAVMVLLGNSIETEGLLLNDRDGVALSPSTALSLEKGPYEFWNTTLPAAPPAPAPATIPDETVQILKEMAVDYMDKKNTIVLSHATSNEDMAFEVDSTANTEDQNIVEDADVIDNILKLLEAADSAHSDGGMTEYKGVMVHRQTAMAMTHVVDKMMEHFGHATTPNVTFQLNQSLSLLPYDEQYSSKKEPPCDRFFSQIKARYNIDDEVVPFDIIAVDNVYVDLKPKVNKHGQVAKDYGKTWVNIYFPRKIMRQLVDRFKENTRWKVSSTGMTTDEGQGLVSVIGNMEVEDAPQFYVMAREEDDKGQPTGRIVIDNRGSIQSVYNDVDLQEIYKCTAFLSVSMNVPVPVGTTIEPEPGAKSMARLKYTVASLKAYGVADNVKSIRTGGARVKSTLFK